MSSDVLIRAEGVSKKFSSKLKTSMKYGIIDIAKDFMGAPTHSDKLRQNEFWSVQDVSFEVRRGECLGLIGPNGAGKSTLLKMLNGIIMPDKGSIEINGRVGALIEVGAGFHPLLSGRENIYINGSIMGLRKKEIDQKFDSIVEFAELGDFIDMPVSYYSSGMYVRLGFAIAAHLEPDVLLIDEVLAVGDIGFRAKCYNVISEFLSYSSIVFVSHSMPEIARLSTKIMLLDNGGCKYSGNNVYEGIDNYYKLHGKPKGSTIESNDGKFEDIKIEYDGKDNIPSISYLDDLSIYISARLNRKIENPIFHVGILSQGLQNICHCSSNNSNLKIESNNQMIKLKVKIKALTIRPGIYYLDFAITDSKNIKIIARTHLCHQIQITGPLSGYGATLSLGEWEIL